MLNRHWPVLTSHTCGYRTISGLEMIIPHLDRLVSWSRGKEGSSVGGAGKGTWNEGEPRWSNYLPVLVVSPCSLARSLIDGLGYDTALGLEVKGNFQLPLIQITPQMFCYHLCCGLRSPSDTLYNVIVVPQLCLAILATSLGAVMGKNLTFKQLCKCTVLVLRAW